MGTFLNDIAEWKDTLSPNPYEPERASGSGELGSVAYTILGINVNGGVKYTALVTGARVKHLGGISKTLAVTVAGNDITVQLGTDGSGNVTSTANQVITAFNGVAAAVALATATATGSGTGLAGVAELFLPLTDDAYGSIRPGLQSLSNRTKYLRDVILTGSPEQRSFKTIYVDGVGDQVVTSTAGEVLSTIGYQAGVSASEYGRLEKYRVKFLNVGSGATSSNPPLGTAMVNDLRAINTPKAWGFLSTNGAGGFLKALGMNFTASFQGADIKITFTAPLNDPLGGVVAYAPNITMLNSALAKPTVRGSIIDLTSFLIKLQDNFVDKDATTTAFSVCFSVFGIQT